MKQIPGLSSHGGSHLKATRSVSIPKARGQEETLEWRGRKCPHLEQWLIHLLLLTLSSPLILVGSSWFASRLGAQGGSGSITECCWVLYIVFTWFGVEKEGGVRLSELDNRNVGSHIRED